MVREQLERDGWILQGNVFASGNKRMLPLYEAKMIHHFDHRLGTYEGQTAAQANVGTLPRLTSDQQDNPDYVVLPRYWVDKTEVDIRLARRSWDKNWLLGWRDICRSSDERTVISTMIPRAAVGDKYSLAFTSKDADLLQANLSSFVFDYAARQKFAGTSLKYFLIKQLPALPPATYEEPVPWLNGATPENWIREHVLEMSFTTWDMESFVRDALMDGGAAVSLE